MTAIGLGVGVCYPTSVATGGSSAVNQGWSTTDKVGNITVSGSSNEVATASSSIVTGQCQSETVKSDNTLYYFEVVTSFTIADYRVGVALDSETNTTRLGQTAGSIGIAPNGQVFNNNALVTTITSYTSGQVVGIWFNPSTGEVWFNVNGTIDGDPGGIDEMSTEPANPTDTITSGATKAGIDPRRLNNAGTIRTTDSEFTLSSEGATGLDE